MMGSEALKIAVLGAGSWGTTISCLLAKKGYEVSLWHRRTEFVQDLIKHKENKRYLPGVKLCNNIEPVDDLQKAVVGAEIAILAVPSHAIRSTCNQILPYINSDQMIVNLAKGLEEDTYLRLSQVINEVLQFNDIFVLSGPSHAEEVAREIPTAVVISGDSKEKSEYLQDVFITEYFRVYINPDMVGVELGGALKNIIALGAGMADGLGYGDNSKAALITRGIVEISRLGKILGAKPETFAGLSGIGDLIVTCTSSHSRNRKAGILLGKGMPLEEVLEEVGMVVEGIKATKTAFQLANIYNCDMPITTGIYNILYEGMDADKVVRDMMTRKKKHEIEEINSLFYQGWS